MNTKKKNTKKNSKKTKKASTPKSDPELWLTTEKALTQDLNDDLLEAWLKLKEFAQSLGEQRIYASGKAIMFSKKVCYVFVRPKKTYLEVVVFLRDPEKRDDFKSVAAVSKNKYAHTFKLVHADQVEGSLTDALTESFEKTSGQATD